MSKGKNIEIATDLHEAEIMGHIKPMDFVVEAPTKPEELEVLFCDDAGRFNYYISKARTEGMRNEHTRSDGMKMPVIIAKHVETTPELMKFLLNGRKGTTISYEGVRIFVKGTREETLRLEEMNVEERAKIR